MHLLIGISARLNFAFFEGSVKTELEFVFADIVPVFSESMSLLVSWSINKLLLDGVPGLDSHDDDLGVLLLLFKIDSFLFKKTIKIKFSLGYFS